MPNRGISTFVLPPSDPLSGDVEQGSAQPAPLENLANNSSPPLTSADAARDRAHDLRRALWHLSTIARCRSCGRSVVGGYVAVVHSPERGAGYGGLETCASVWACPVCARKIAARRSVEIGEAVGAWQDQGGASMLVTLTMRHHAGHRLCQEINALTSAWSRTTSSRVWHKQLHRLGSPGWVRVLEITWSAANGWHAHLHFVLFVAGSTSSADVAGFTDWLFPKWSRMVSDAGMPAPLAVGQDARLVDGATAAHTLGEYLSKPPGRDPAHDLGRELMGAFTKTARGEHSTVPAWRIPERFLETGDADLLDLWQEYERATFRRRQLTWAGGLRDRLALGQEATDEGIVDEAAGDDVVLFITRAGWRTVLSLPEPTSRLLAVLEHGGSAALRAYLDARGVEYVTELSVAAGRDRS